MNEMRSDYLFKSSLQNPPNLGLVMSGLQQILFFKILKLCRWWYEIEP